MPETKNTTIKDGQLSSLLLYLSFCLVVFYPFKGFISFLWSSLVGVNLSVIVIPFIFIFVISFLLLNTIVNHIHFQNKADVILFACGFLGVSFALIGNDKSLLSNTVLLFFLPVLLSSMGKVDDGFFFKTVFLFFTISTVYLFVENVILHPWRYGLSFNAPNYGRLSNYIDYLSSSADFNALVNLVDYRHIGASYRTAGYLGNLFAMPVIIAMTATLYYVLLREQASVRHFCFALIAFYMLISCISTTAIMAFLLTIIFYECYLNKGFLLILIFLVVAVMIFFCITTTQPHMYINGY